MQKRLHDWLIGTWYGDSGRGRWLLPLAWLFAGAAALRRSLYERGILARYRSPRLVVIVGNLTVGGAGKTPFVIWLAGELERIGYERALRHACRRYAGNAASVWKIIAHCVCERILYVRTNVRI